MSCQPLVQEREVGVEQVEHAAILADHRREEQLGFARHRLPQTLVEIGKQAIVGVLDRDEVAQVEPLPGEILDQCVGPRIGEHPLHLGLEDPGSLELPAARQIEQLIVGNAAPEEERQS